MLQCGLQCRVGDAEGYRRLPFSKFRIPPLEPHQLWRVGGSAWSELGGKLARHHGTVALALEPKRPWVAPVPSVCLTTDPMVTPNEPGGVDARARVQARKDERSSGSHRRRARQRRRRAE